MRRRHDEWDEQRSSYGRALENLEAVIRAHPSSGGSDRGERGLTVADQERNGTQSTALPDNVVDLRSRLALARSGSIPDDAA